MNLKCYLQTTVVTIIAVILTTQLTYSMHRTSEVTNAFGQAYAFLQEHGPQPSLTPAKRLLFDIYPRKSLEIYVTILTQRLSALYIELDQAKQIQATNKRLLLSGSRIKSLEKRIEQDTQEITSLQTCIDMHNELIELVQNALSSLSDDELYENILRRISF